jgi:hypothetical protein
MNIKYICPNCKSSTIEIREGYIDPEGDFIPYRGFCEDCWYEDFLECFEVKIIKNKKNKKIKNYSKIYCKKLKI